MTAKFKKRLSNLCIDNFKFCVGVVVGMMICSYQTLFLKQDINNTTCSIILKELEKGFEHGNNR